MPQLILPPTSWRIPPGSTLAIWLPRCSCNQRGLYCSRGLPPLSYVVSSTGSYSASSVASSRAAPSGQIRQPLLPNRAPRTTISGFSEFGAVPQITRSDYTGFRSNDDTVSVVATDHASDPDGALISLNGPTLPAAQALRLLDRIRELEAQGRHIISVDVARRRGGGTGRLLFAFDRRCPGCREDMETLRIPFSMVFPGASDDESHSGGGSRVGGGRLIESGSLVGEGSHVGGYRGGSVAGSDMTDPLLRPE